MKTPVEEYKEPRDSKQMLQSLILVKTALRRLPLPGKAYAPLVGLILELNWAEKPPTANALQKQLKIDGKLYRRWLDALFTNFLALIEADTDALQFTDVEHLFFVDGWFENIEFRCRLAVTPRFGENIELPFLEAATGSTAFYVNRITHEYQQGKTVITLSLRAGRFNSYLHQMGQRARYDNKFERKAWGMSDTELTEYYRAMYPDSPAPTPAPGGPGAKRTGGW
jgi:hypothetical protein